MAEFENEKNGNNILYELLVFSEWYQDFDSGLPKTAFIASQSHTDAVSYFNPWKLFAKSKSSNKRFQQNEYPWHLAVSQDGKVAAVLQESLLEIRTAKDEYSSVVGKATVHPDPCPQLRRLAWSPDNTFLAVAHDNGSVNLYDLLGCNIATIQPVESSNNASLQPVIGLLFLQLKFKSAKWSNELMIAYSNGIVRSVLLSALDGCDYEENIKFSLEKYYPQGITAVAYHPTFHTILVAGPSCSDTHGITVWRILTDYPYLKIAFDSVKTTANSRSFFRFLPGFSNQNNPCTVAKMRISPAGDLLACLHFSGDISLWHLPGIRPHKRWTLVKQPQYNICNPQGVESGKNEVYFYPIDITWWSNSALAIARRSGAVTVCSISTLENLLGDSPEFLAGPPQISSINGERSGVIALECEITCNYRNRGRIEDSEMDSDSESETSVLQASIQAALYSVTDIERFQPKRKTPKIIQRTYRLLALKRTTPEELYSRKIHNEEYDEALSLAEKYHLDSDLVYQRQWRTSDVSVHSIYSFLDKVKKLQWVANECVERVPDTVEAARELLHFGLRITDLEEEVNDEHLNTEKVQLVSFRRKLLKFSDNLTLYEKIISSYEKYNPSDYDSFRRKLAIEATVDFARQENWQAVAIMFTYCGKETLPHWLPILSNFPETLPPIHYRSLLPEVMGEEIVPWVEKKLRDMDWCEKDMFKTESVTESDASARSIYQSEPSLIQFNTSILTPKLVEDWYRKRCYEIEHFTGLVEHALNLVKLARERNVKNLERLYFDLLTLEALVYSVQDDFSFPKLESLSHLEQAKLLLSKTTKETLTDHLKDLVLPLAIRCEKQGCDTKYSLIRGLLLDMSIFDLEYPLQLLKHLKEDKTSPLRMTVIESMSLALECLYNCSRSDQLEIAFLILECLPEREPGTCSDEEEQLHDKIDVLENHLEVCEIISRYNAPKSVRFIAENETNENLGKELMKNMAEYTRSESLDFSELLSDLQDVQSKVFTCIDPLFCYEVYVLSRMSCECEEIIQSAEDVLECRKGEPQKMIPFDRSVELVLEAAKAHFERATGFDDPCITLSQTCLRLISEPHPAIHEEFDLIESVQLLGDFDVRLLPLQVRLCSDRLKLIEYCLTAKPKAYKSWQRLLQLAQTLRIAGEDRLKREGQVLTMIAEYALLHSDHHYCGEICRRLISRNYSPAWPTIRLLGQSHEYENISQKKFFLAFTILHCPSDILEELIESRIALSPPVFSQPESQFSRDCRTKENQRSFVHPTDQKHF